MRLDFGTGSYPCPRGAGMQQVHIDQCAYGLGFPKEVRNRRDLVLGLDRALVDEDRFDRKLNRRRMVNASGGVDGLARNVELISQCSWRPTLLEAKLSLRPIPPPTLNRYVRPGERTLSRSRLGRWCTPKPRLQPRWASLCTASGSCGPRLTWPTISRCMLCPMLASTCCSTSTTPASPE